MGSLAVTSRRGFREPFAVHLHGHVNRFPYGCDPANFANAYRRVVDIIRGRGIDETKVRFAFAPNGWTDPKCGSIGSYYPGNAYVDVIGISSYRWGEEGVYSVMGGAVDQVFLCRRPS